MIGMNAVNGRALSDLDHLRQSVRDILMTPIGSRVMRRDYGSALWELVDSSLTPLTLVQIYSATADALRKWEPRLRVLKVDAETAPADLKGGRISITVLCEYLPDGRNITIDGVVL